MKRPLALCCFFALSASAIAAFVTACGDDEPRAGGAPDSGGSDAPGDRRASDDASTGEVDARADASTCELTRAYTLECNLGADAGDVLNCGGNFDSWCAGNDKAVNSAAYRRAEAFCLTKKNCDAVSRRDCEYRSYATAAPSAAQKAVVAAYCQTCEPTSADCAVRKADYDPTLGPASTDDVFVAAWELSDAIDDGIRTKCTGPALDAGAAALPDAGGDAEACLKAFGSCAADVYLNAIPDCP